MATRPAALVTRPLPAAVAVVAANLVVVAAVVTSRPAGSAVIAVLLAAPIVGVAAYAIYARPQRGLLLLAALLPFDGLQAIIGFPAGWKEGLVVLTLGAALVAPESTRGEPGRRVPTWAYPSGALVALGTVSAAFVGGTRGLVGLKVGFFFILAAVIAWLCPLNARERDRLVTILMATGFLTAVVGIAQQLVGDERLVQFGWEYNTNIRFAGGFLRSFSTFDVNFPFALFLMLVVLIGLPCALEDTERRRNQLFLVSLPIVLAALVCTVTRGPWLGLGIGLLYMGLSRYRSILRGLAHAVVIGAVALVVVGSYTSAFLSSTSSEERFDVWRENLSEIASHPLGAGIGATGSAAEKTLEVKGESVDPNDPSAGDSDILQPDNSYFKTTLELGVIGLWLFVMMLVTAFLAVHGAARRLTGTDAALARGTAALVLAASAVSLVANYFEVFPLDAYFWLLIGVVATCVPESR